MKTTPISNNTNVFSENYSTARKSRYKRGSRLFVAEEVESGLMSGSKEDNSNEEFDTNSELEDDDRDGE